MICFFHLADVSVEGLREHHWIKGVPRYTFCVVERFSHTRCLDWYLTMNAEADLMVVEDDQRSAIVDRVVVGRSSAAESCF